MRYIVLILLMPLIVKAELRSVCFGTIENDTLLEAFSKEYPYCNPQNCIDFYNEQAQLLCPKFDTKFVTIEDASFTCTDTVFEMLPNPENYGEIVKIRTSNKVIKEEFYKNFKIRCKK